jgi:transcription elongation factor Elf1
MPKRTMGPMPPTVLVLITCPRCKHTCRGTALKDGPSVQTFQCSRCGYYPIYGTLPKEKSDER